MIVETTRKEMKVCSDVIFKAIFLREKEILLKMIYDITDISETMHYEEVLTGYELEPYKVNGKVNKSDMLIKINNRYFINIEVNFKHQKNVLYRNMIQLFRICGQVVESGMTDNELTLKKVGQLNFNTFSNSNNKVLERGYYTNEEGNVLNDLLNIWNIDIVKCYKTLYNNVEREEKLPKVVKWGAVLYSNIDKIEGTLDRIGDLLTMEEKERLVKRVNEVKKNKKIIQEWMVIENNRLREEDILNTAKEDALKDGIEQGIEQGIEIGIVQGTCRGAEIKEIELIKNMLNKNIDYCTIAEVTSKTIEEIKEIEKN
ncbi:MAG: hypothetical protein IJZ46_01330 [Bacilli bacterium]|nr:hypothetical protein [Bacilli bacterium]